MLRQGQEQGSVSRPCSATGLFKRPHIGHDVEGAGEYTDTVGSLVVAPALARLPPSSTLPRALSRKGTPMQGTSINTNDLTILSRVLEPNTGNLHPEAARALLALDFSQADKDRMRQLS